MENKKEFKSPELCRFSNPTLLCGIFECSKRRYKKVDIKDCNKICNIKDWKIKGD